MKESSDYPGFRIRNATTDDSAVLVEMVERIARLYPAGYNQGWLGSADGFAYVTYHIEKGWVAVAEQNHVLIGHCAWSVKQGLPYQAYVRYAELQTLFVGPAVRGQGVAEALLHAFNGFCSAAALSVQIVHAVPDPKALAMFEKIGFREERRLMVRIAND